ncbi:MAG: OmpH family outer membrane protein [Chitinophagaceae bacterium]|nr:OmpH family outer membrane protein [Chitinophagaceae bacterium]MBK7305757.1 OmpH family outer membrane protein [Chitinophagaceae bacterium]MBK8784998.1 OmpH family outer membrane protein [Chitinophagaceae bacterium]MBK9484194.1 OmpH family outer membrane protein [Chitinophagaceae bacterium]MBL0198796.1 OmpH family outer membrane protein [Chitinophagaceae bacterium]
MKKLLLGAVMALGMMTTSAQTKIGYINTDELMSIMPEAAKINSDLNEYQTTLQQQGITLQKEAETKRDQFFKDSATFSNSKKEIIRDELVKLYTRLQGYDQEIQEKAQKYAQEKIAPVRAKALDAIKAVAKEKGYTYVIDEASSSLLVMPPGDDLLPAVKTKLGIKDAPQAPAGTKPAGN